MTYCESASLVKRYIRTRLRDGKDAAVAEFEDSYKSLCHRDFDGRVDPLRTLLKMSARHGVARAVDAPEGDPQPFAILIWPGVVEVLIDKAQ